ncbi:MAG: transglycosylase SLT domain-containing protein [Candidatus Sericytochromatia bacterium]
MDFTSVSTLLTQLNINVNEVAPSQTNNNATEIEHGTISNLIDTFKKDFFQLTQSIGNIGDNIKNIDLFGSHGKLPPVEQLNYLGKKYNVPFKGNLDTFQSEIAKKILTVKAQEYGIPLEVALGVAKNESGLKMWDSRGIAQGKTVAGRNETSTDWGVMQINDKAHAKAFPRAKYDMEYNIDYGLKFLANQRKNIKGNLGLGLGDWDRTIASYNLGHDPNSSRSYQIASKYVSNVARNSSYFA